MSGNSLRQTVHTHCVSVHQAAKLVAALLRLAGVTAGLAESNGSLPSGLWFTTVICRLQNPTSTGNLFNINILCLPEVISAAAMPTAMKAASTINNENFNWFLTWQSHTHAHHQFNGDFPHTPSLARCKIGVAVCTSWCQYKNFSFPSSTAFWIKGHYSLYLMSKASIQHLWPLTKQRHTNASAITAKT